MMMVLLDMPRDSYYPFEEGPRIWLPLHTTSLTNVNREVEWNTCSVMFVYASIDGGCKNTHSHTHTITTVDLISPPLSNCVCPPPLSKCVCVCVCVCVCLHFN